MFLRDLIGVVIVKKIVFLRDNKTEVSSILLFRQLARACCLCCPRRTVYVLEAIVGVLENCLL